MTRKTVSELCLSLLLATFVIFFYSNNKAYAQDDAVTPSPVSQEAGKAPDAQASDDSFNAPETDFLAEMPISGSLGPNDGYVSLKLANLSRLYWAVGKFDLSDDLAIDEYIMINDCELHANYYGNDLEWPNIRDSMRSYIEKNLGEFPVRFEIVVPIYLDRYDPVEKVFPISREVNRVNGARKIDTLHTSTQFTCRRMKSDEKLYPKNLIFYLEEKLSMPFVPVEPALAELFMQEADSRFRRLPTKLREQKYERMAYLRLKVKITSYKETVKSQNGPKAIVLAKAEGIEVYADEQTQKLIYSKSLKRSDDDWRSGQGMVRRPGKSIIDQLTSDEPLIKQPDVEGKDSKEAN